MTLRPHRTASGPLALLLAVAATLAGCGGPGAPDPGDVVRPTGQPVDVPDLRAAESATREDSVYPDAGDPTVDALHYHLDLAWTPDLDLLTAIETLTFRATADADRIPLDFNDVLEITGLTVDGDDADYEQSADDLVIEHPVTADTEYRLRLEYAGTPASVPGPTERADIDGLGWHVTDRHEVWTMQEPYGAFTWYAVNDQPADKALYDFTLTVPEPWTGVANGELTDTTDDDGLRTTAWHLAEPAASYLITVAFADHEPTELASESGVPITVWDLTEDGYAGETGYAPDAITWLERILGPYPFDTAGVVINRGMTGMETQTMITLGNNPYSTSREVMVHELAHHWYGDAVTPADWSDVWMNEGMAMYLQWMWEAEQAHTPMDDYVDGFVAEDQTNRDSYGPPAAYQPDKFGAHNIYVNPALMWHELRQRIGDRRFFAMLRAWPRRQDNRSVSRAAYLSWIERRTGEELSAFFRAWLLGDRTPPT